MWHENSEEIAVCLVSVFKVDEDYSARQTARNQVIIEIITDNY